MWIVSNQYIIPGSNPQFDYYPVEELDEIFNKIWMQLHKENEKLFPTEVLYKFSDI